EVRGCLLGYLQVPGARGRAHVRPAVILSIREADLLHLACTACSRQANHAMQTKVPGILLGVQGTTQNKTQTNRVAGYCSVGLLSTDYQITPIQENQASARQAQRPQPAPDDRCYPGFRPPPPGPR